MRNDLKFFRSCRYNGSGSPAAPCVRSGRDELRSDCDDQIDTRRSRNRLRTPEPGCPQYRTTSDSARPEYKPSPHGAVWCSRMLYGPSSVALSDRALARKRTGDEAGSGARPVVRKSLVP